MTSIRKAKHDSEKNICQTVKDKPKVFWNILNPIQKPETKYVILCRRIEN